MVRGWLAVGSIFKRCKRVMKAERKAPAMKISAVMDKMIGRVGSIHISNGMVTGSGALLHNGLYIYRMCRRQIEGTATPQVN